MILTEYIGFDNAHLNVVKESKEDGKSDLFMKGIFIQGGVKNHNGRIYPVNEIRRAVDDVNAKIKSGLSVVGEMDHPAELQIHLGNVSHEILDMWMDGSNGLGKLKILPTTSGNVIRALLESGIKLGVSSRGSGEVGYNGEVKDFEMLTVDIVMNPSAPNAYPKTVYESLMNMKRGQQVYDLAECMKHDQVAQKHLKKLLLSMVDEL